MFDNLLLLLEGAAPSPPVTVTAQQTGGYPTRRQFLEKPELLLSFKFGFLATGEVLGKPALPPLNPVKTVTYSPFMFTIHGIKGSVIQRLQVKLPISGSVSEVRRFTFHATGRPSVVFRYGFYARGKVRKSLNDLASEVDDLRYLAADKENLNQEIERLNMGKEIAQLKYLLGQRKKRRKP